MEAMEGRGLLELLEKPLRADRVQGNRWLNGVGVGRGVQMMMGWIYIRCKYCLQEILFRSRAASGLDQNQERGRLQ